MSEQAQEADRWEAPSFADHAQRMPTAGELEALQQRAWDEAHAEGYAAGLEAGTADGLRAGEAEVRERMQLLDGMLEHLRAPLAQLDDTLETELTQMVLAMIKRLFRRQLELDPNSIKGLVRDAVLLLPVSTRAIEIHVHPDDAERLESIAPPVAEHDGEDAQRWQLVGDASVTRGGCIVNCGASRIDASVESRIDALVVGLLGDERQ